MAKISVSLHNSKIAELERLGQMTTEVMDAMLAAAGEIGKQALKVDLRWAIGDEHIGKERSTGELLDSVGVSPADYDHKAVRNVRIGFNEPRRKQYPAKRKRSYHIITNAMIAATIEYGRYSTRQVGRPFMANAKIRSRPAIKAEMERVFREEVNK